jgi:hypothetical protein
LAILQAALNKENDMYSNHDEINNPYFLTHVRPIPDAFKFQADDQDNNDNASTELEEDADPAHITTVPFSTTKVGSFQ